MSAEIDMNKLKARILYLENAIKFSETELGTHENAVAYWQRRIKDDKAALASIKDVSDKP